MFQAAAQPIFPITILSRIDTFISNPFVSIICMFQTSKIYLPFYSLSTLPFPLIRFLSTCNLLGVDYTEIRTKFDDLFEIRKANCASFLARFIHFSIFNETSERIPILLENYHFCTKIHTFFKSAKQLKTKVSELHENHFFGTKIQICDFQIYGFRIGVQNLLFQSDPKNLFDFDSMPI